MANKVNLGNAILSNSPGTGGTTFSISGYGSAMPGAQFYATATPPGQLSTMGNSEIVLVTAKSTDDLTVTRAQKGTTAQDVQDGWILSNGVYVEDIDAAVQSTTTETVTVSTTEPTSPETGDVWFDTTRKIGQDDIDWTTFLNGKIEVQYGSGSITATSGTVVTNTITFAEAFSGTPTVFVQSSTGQGTAIQTVYAATGVSSTGFTVNARHPSASGAVGYRWVAIYANYS